MRQPATNAGLAKTVAGSSSQRLPSSARDHVVACSMSARSGARRATGDQAYLSHDTWNQGEAERRTLNTERRTSNGARPSGEGRREDAGETPVLPVDDAKIVRVVSFPESTGIDCRTTPTRRIGHA
jgi:hypothetical protein